MEALLIDNDELINKYNDIWNKLAVVWKPKKKSYSDEDTDFHTKEILKVGFNYKKSLKRWTDLLVYSNWYFFVYLFIYILNFTPKFIHVSQGLISN